MTNVRAHTAADSLLEHLKLSDSDASVFLDTTTDPPTLRLFIFSKALLSGLTLSEWHGFSVKVVHSARFCPL
jgi:hypothetical protein